jgi:hypothetical protein
VETFEDWFTISWPDTSGFKRLPATFWNEGGGSGSPKHQEEVSFLDCIKAKRLVGALCSWVEYLDERDLNMTTSSGRRMWVEWGGKISSKILFW